MSSKLSCNRCVNVHSDGAAATAAVRTHVKQVMDDVTFCQIQRSVGRPTVRP